MFNIATVQYVYKNNVSIVSRRVCICAWKLLYVCDSKCCHDVSLFTSGIAECTESRIINTIKYILSYRVESEKKMNKYFEPRPAGSHLSLAYRLETAQSVHLQQRNLQSAVQDLIDK